MQRRNSVEFWDSWNAKVSYIPTDIARDGKNVPMGKMGLFVYLSCLLFELLSLKCKNGSFFVFSVDDSKKSVTVWAKYLRAPERI